jgi:hypothetical protein
MCADVLPATLRELLSREKPIISHPSPTTDNTIDAEWPELRNIKIWSEFTLGSLNESYGHILDRDLSQNTPEPPESEALPHDVISSDEDINILIDWHNSLPKQCVEFAESHLGLTVQIFPLLYPRRGRASTQPVDRVTRVMDEAAVIFIAGVWRSSSSWKSTELMHQLEQPAEDLEWPLRQLANQCQEAQTRYGYILTEKELVVCRFSYCLEWTWAKKIPVSAEIMPIPWTNQGVDTLTTELAMWWLSALAMAAFHAAPGNNRDLCAEDYAVPISKWHIDQLGCGRGWTRRHNYSDFEQTILPPPPPRDTLACVNNPAAVFTNMGHFTGSDFDVISNPGGIYYPPDGDYVNNGNYYDPFMGFDDTKDFGSNYLF